MGDTEEKGEREEGGRKGGGGKEIEGEGEKHVTKALSHWPEGTCTYRNSVLQHL